MPYSDSITRSDADSLIPQPVANEIMTSVYEMNPILSLARKLPNMVAGQEKLPVLDAMASAFFLNGSKNQIETTKVSWDDRFIDPEGISAIIPIPRTVINDSKYDLFGQCKPELEKAISVVITNAILHGINIPSSWTTNLGYAGIIAGSLAVGNTVSLAAYTDMYEALLGEKADGTAGMFGKLEDEGFIATGSICATPMKRKLRNVRTSDGAPIFVADPKEKTPYTLDGSPCFFPTDGTLVASQALAVAGQWDQLVWAWREDISFEILKEAVIQDASGAIIYNLAQQHMVGLKVFCRIGVALPNPINRAEPDATKRYPIAVLKA